MAAAQIVFFAVALLIWSFFHVWIGRRLFATHRVPTWGKRLGWALVVILAVAPFASVTLGRAAPGLEHVNLVHWIGFTAMGLSVILICFVIVLDLPRQILRVGRRARRGWRRSTSKEQSGGLQKPERRHFFTDLANLGLVGGAAGLTGVGFARAQRIPAVVEVEIPIENLPDGLEGLRIVQLTDVHIGPTIHGEWLRRVVERVNELKPDLTVITGDLVDGFVWDLAPHVAPLAGLESTHGSFFVTGNHEYFWDGRAWCEHLSELGLKVLNNDHQVIETGGARLLMAGVTDYSTGGRVPGHASDPRATMKAAPPNDLSVLLAHQPRSIFEASRVGFDIQLSGHTHGGQFFPMTVLINLFQPYVSGLHLHDGTWLYVSRGTGYWGPPNRAGAPAEITLITLARA
jgi:predicted MPP superfamily phosphohydrolase